MVGRPRKYFVYSLSPPPPHINPQKSYLSIVFNFSWDSCNTQEKWKTKLLQNLFCGGGRGVTKVYYGRCANGEWVINVAQSLRSDLKQQYPSSWHSPLNKPFPLFVFHQKIRYTITMTIRLSLLRPQALRREVVKEGMPGREAPLEKVTQSWSLDHRGVSLTIKGFWNPVKVG